MARSIFSAAVLLVAVAGVTGCTGSAHFVGTGVDPATGVGVVNVPQSDWCQWWYRHEGLEFIRDNCHLSKDPEIITQGEVVNGQVLTGRQYGPDGKPLVYNKNGDKEWQIVFRVPVRQTTTTLGGAPMMGTPVSNQAPMPGTVVPAGGVQNLNGIPPTGQYQPAGQSTYSSTGQSYSPNQPFTPSMPPGVNGGMQGSGYPGGGYGTR